MIENLFSAPIYVAKVDNFDKIQEEIEETLKKTDFSMISGWGRTHYLSTTDFNDDIIDKSLKKEIEKHLFKYKTEISSNFEYSEYDMISWFTKCGKDNYAHMHNHGASDISGVYYHKTNGEDGNLFFHTPNPFLDTSNFYMHLGNQWEHTPFEGKLLLFPAWLMHGVRENPTDNERISLSFNITFRNRV